MLLVVVAEALVFSLVAFGQFAIGDVFWNPEVIAANEAHTYFRVNSLFWDPNILGRYLVLVVLAVAAYMVWTPTRGRAWASAAVCAVLLAAVALTFSQSSLVALLGGLLVLVGDALGRALGARRDRRGGSGRRRLAGGERRRPQLESSRSTSAPAAARAWSAAGSSSPPTGRSPDMAPARSGEFEQRFPDDAEGDRDRSRTPSRSRWRPSRGSSASSLTSPCSPAVAGTLLTRAQAAADRRARALVACFAGLFVHSLAYAGLLIDPVTWALVAAGFALARYSVQE